MSQLTLEAIKAEHARVAEMITTFEAQSKAAAAFPITVTCPELKPGEILLATIITSTRKYHSILLPGDNDGASQEYQLAWAKSIGGDLLNRVEQAIAFAEFKDHFQEAAYWSNERHASDSDCAWCQNFYHGNQYYNDTISKLRARAVRRLEIL